jgi:lipopolysaccharide transport system permease protein
VGCCIGYDRSCIAGLGPAGKSIVRHRWRTLLPIYALFIYTTLLHAATHAEARLSEPFQPFLLILIVGAVLIRWKMAINSLEDPHMEGFRTSFQGRRLIYLRDLLRELVARDMKLRYKRSVLGIAWSLLNPLAQLLVFNFIFHLVLPLNIPNYTSFLFIGLLAWSWFQSSLFTATSAIVDNRELIRRPGFPVAVLPAVTVMSHLIHFLLALPILLLFLMFNGIQLTNAIVALPLVIALQFLLTLSLAYFVAALHVTFRDTQYLLGIFLLLAFYLSPVFYDASAIPARYQLFYHLNPMVNLLGAYRAVLMEGELPHTLPILVIGVLGTGLLWLGYTIFMRASYHFVEEL